MAEDREIRPWHHFSKEFREALQSNDKEAFALLVDEALGGDNIIRTDDMLIDGNEHGRSYNCMGQSDMGLALIRAGRMWDVGAWVDDGIAALNVMLTKYGAGGLRLRDAASETAWYCGQTGRLDDDMGGTLNKHLYATRTFFLAAREMERLGDAAMATRYEQAGEEGYLKLVKGRQAAMLQDFFVQAEGEDYHLGSWVYYACNDASKGRGYFLDDSQKNASYHLFDMELISQIGNLADDDFDLTPFHKEQLGSISAFGGMLRVYRNKLDSGGLGQDTETARGQFSSTINGADDALDIDVNDWFEQFLFAPPVFGKEEDDRLHGSERGETLKGFEGLDTLMGDGGSDKLRGGRASDILKGGGGRDTLCGGHGSDMIKGQKGDDVFRFGATAESAPGDKRDTIADFERSGDTVDLHAIDAREERSGQQSFDYVGNAPFSGRSGELRFEGGILMADTDGDARSDLEIAILNIDRMDIADIVL
jgi:hypothetical protein